VSCYPNAGLPNPMSDTGFDETPEVTSALVEEFAASGLVNLVAAAAAPRPITSPPSPRRGQQDAAHLARPVSRSRTIAA
jgi:hypothetical protein